MIVWQLAIRRWLVAVAALIGAIGTLGVASGTAFAHAELTSSNPANQAILATQPSDILLTFSEDIDPVDDSIRMVDADGNPAPIGMVDQLQGKNTLHAPVALIPDGTYIVGWQAISADSHKIRGAFTFSVGAATPTAPGVIDELFDAGSSDQSDSLLLGVGRFLSYAGIGVLLGALFLAAMLVPELIGERRIGTLLVAAALTAVAGTGVMFVAQAHLITGSYVAWVEVVQIQSGQWWLARLAAIGLFALFIPARAFLASTPGRVELGLASLVLCGVIAAGGHAVAGDIVVAGFVATTIHLAAMSIWLGGLALLAFGVPRSWFWWTASQFSPWALGAVVVLALTGSVNAWRQLGSLSGLTGSSYGRWLVIKLMLVALVVAVAFFSRRLAHSDDDDEEAVEEPTTADAIDETGIHPEAVVGDDPDVGVGVSPRQEAPAALRRTVLFEIAGIALILMATAGLVNSPPPPSAATTESASAVVGDRIVQVELEPAVTGGTEMHVYLSSPSGGLDRPDEITVTASLPSADLGPLDIETIPAGPNHVIATDVKLPIAGLWTFDVTARFGEFDQVVFTVQIPVSD